MATQIRHHEHVYTYDHPVGWHGGDEHVRAQLNASRPAGEYPLEEAEKWALRRALNGVLTGGEVISQVGSHLRRGVSESDEEGPESGVGSVNPDRILDPPFRIEIRSDNDER